MHPSSREKKAKVSLLVNIKGVKYNTVHEVNERVQEAISHFYTSKAHF